MKTAMLSISTLFKKEFSFKILGVKRYRTPFALDRINLGVDNIHCDVHLSKRLFDALQKTAFLLMIRHSGTEFFFKDYKRDLCEAEKDALKNICNDVLLDGINKAKVASEVQIDFLAQTSVIKLFLKEIKAQYHNLVAQMEPLVRLYQLSERYDQNDLFFIKNKIAEIKLHYDQITRLVGKELFEMFHDVNVRKLREMRETLFSSHNILPGYFLANPFFHTNNPNNDFFLIEEYVLMGQRSEDRDNYNNLRSMIYNLLGQIEFKSEDFTDDRDDTAGRKPGKVDDVLQAENYFFDLLIMEPDNIDKMLDYFDSLDQLGKAKKSKEPDGILGKIKERMNAQKMLLDTFYRSFKKAGLIRPLVAGFEMKQIYEKFCPPMSPRQVRDFLVKFWTRLSLRTQQKRLKSLYGEEFSLEPLFRTVKKVNQTSAQGKKQYLIMFLKHFSRYHRDLVNFRSIRNAMDSINLLTEEKLISLSRENYSLYEFLLPEEKVKEEKPIANHVILKADIRGSININNTMRNMGLNPASYFSLNFFDPISAVLSEYGASKVFIEGDAIILSIFEKEEPGQLHYSVALACGLAVRILLIVQNYNEKNRENNLPPLECGVGICYCQGAPTFLLDGNAKIMISQAINLADRMSSCDKMLRKIFKSQNDIFNLFVFENESEDAGDAPLEDLTYRYNVNGIELNEDGFNKLLGEINLQTFTFPSEHDENVRLYSGKVPLTNGNYQRIIIREATVHKVQPTALNVIGKVSKKYYEVCTHQEIYDFIEKHA